MKASIEKLRHWLLTLKKLPFWLVAPKNQTNNFTTKVKSEPVSNVLPEWKIKTDYAQGREHLATNNTGFSICKDSNIWNDALYCVAPWRSGRVLDLRSIGCGFESQPPRCWVHRWARTHVPLSPSSISWYQPMGDGWYLVAGKVSVGLASHWPHVTDIKWFSTYGLKA